MVDYLQRIWRCRYFWLMLVKMDLRARYRRSVLGLGWSLLQPIAMTIIICVVFSSILAVGDSPAHFAGYVLAGLACWNYIVHSTVLGCHCLTMGENYIRQYPAPMAIYPLRVALGGTFHFLVATSVVLLLSWCLNGFGNVFALPALLGAIGLLFVLTWSLAVLAGFANVYFQDTHHLVEVGFQILFYTTPIMYPESLLKAQNLGWLARYNPLRALVDLVRLPLLNGEVPPASTWLMAGLTTGLLAAAASATLVRCQKRVIFAM